MRPALTRPIREMKAKLGIISVKDSKGLVGIAIRLVRNNASKYKALESLPKIAVPTKRLSVTLRNVVTL